MSKFLSRVKPLKKSSKHMSWAWIKERSQEDHSALTLVLLAKEIGDEPNRLAGMNKIRDWLFDLGVPRFYFEILNEMEIVYHNTKKFR